MFLEDYSCVLCNIGHEETLLHLFFECPFSTSCWQSISIHQNLNLQPLDMAITAREQFGSNIFREIIITACWAIWLVKNGIIFDNEHVSLHSWKRRFKEELGLVCAKAKPTRRHTLNLWRDSIFDVFFFCLLGLVALYSFLVFCLLLYSSFFHSIEKQKKFRQGASLLIRSKKLYISKP